MANSAEPDRIDDIANDLDDLKLSVDELKADPPLDVEPKTIDSLGRALEDATEAANDLENQKD
jgi:hypothetical protein